MKIVFLGTASAFPTPTRGVSCTALQHDDGNVWLFDCGEGSQIQLQKSSLKIGKISKIFITHLHGDHMFGLPGLLCTLANGQDPKMLEAKIIDIYGPHGLRKYIATTLSLSRSPLAYRIRVFEIIPRPDQYPENWSEWEVNHCLEESFKLPQEQEYIKIEYCSKIKGWKLMEQNNLVVHAAALEHRIPSFGFHIQEGETPGQLNASKLKEIGIRPGPLFGKLKQGQSVNFEGKTLKPEDFVGPSIRGREVVILGDTCNSDELLNFTKSPDMFLHEATMENSLQEKCIEYGHSTPNMAADIAIRCKAKSLMLFHLSPRYKPIDESSEDGSAHTILKEAQEYITSEKANMKVDVAHDFKEVVITRS